MKFTVFFFYVYKGESTTLLFINLKNMKNLKLYALIACGVASGSCEKEEITHNTNDTNQNEISSISKQSNLRVWYNTTEPGEIGTEGVDFGCKDSGGNCQDDITIYGGMAVIEDVLDDVATGDGSIIINSFYNNKEDLELYIDKTIVENVYNGNLYVSIKNRTNDGINYLIFDDGQRIVNVYPLAL